MNSARVGNQTGGRGSKRSLEWVREPENFQYSIIRRWDNFGQGGNYVWLLFSLSIYIEYFLISLRL
jgi:hypothetical protein